MGFLRRSAHAEETSTNWSNNSNFDLPFVKNAAIEGEDRTYTSSLNGKIKTENTYWSLLAQLSDSFPWTKC